MELGNWFPTEELNEEPKISVCIGPIEDEK